MKRFVILTALALLAGGVFAQDYSATEKKKSQDEEVRTLFKKSGHKPDIGYVAGATASYTQFDGQSAWLAGMHAGVIVDHNFTFGLAGNLLVNGGTFKYDVAYGAYPTYNLSGGYGGFYFAYTLFPKSPVHVSFPVTIGAGWMGWVAHDAHYWDNGNYYYSGNWDLWDHDNFFVLEPGVQLEVNLVKFMRLGIGATYRYAPNFDLEGTATNFLNQFNGTVSLKFGKF